MKINKLTIEIKNIGLTNSMRFAPKIGSNDKFDTLGLLKREGVESRIKELSELKDLTNSDFEFYFNNLCNTIFTCIKSARSSNFDEPFW